MLGKNKKIKVSVDKSHLFTLGEKMYRESIEFVRELVNNAYDADATEVRVFVSDKKIIIHDNGSGMNEKGFEQFFAIGSEEKKIRNVSPRFRRKRIGQFGIGKFSALALANQFIIESVKGKFKYLVIFNRHDWQKSNNWYLPIKKEMATALEVEGTKITLNQLYKKISLAETEKYLRQSVPLRAKKFSVFLNNKKITPKIIAGKIIPINIKTMYGPLTGEITIALNSRDVVEPGVECRIKQVMIKRELFGLDKKYSHGISYITGSVNADWLSLISARSDFIIDSPEYKLFFQLMRAELEKVLTDFKKRKDSKNLKKITAELNSVMKQIREALGLNPDFIPQGKAISRLKKDAKKKIAFASANINKKSELKNKNSDNNKKDKEEIKKQKIEAKPLAIKRIRLKKFGISCGIISLGEKGPEVLSQGSMVYINQDHPTYLKLYKKQNLLSLHLIRLITQEIVIMKKPRIGAREAFEWQSKLFKDTI